MLTLNFRVETTDQAGEREEPAPHVNKPTLQEHIRALARFPWHEVTTVKHYYLSVDALKRQMQVREGGEE